MTQHDQFTMITRDTHGVDFDLQCNVTVKSTDLLRRYYAYLWVTAAAMSVVVWLCGCGVLQYYSIQRTFS